MKPEPDASRTLLDKRKRLFMIYKSGAVSWFVFVALVLLPVMELWRDEISINRSRSLFALDFLCMVVVSVDAACAVYFKFLQSEMRGSLFRSIACYYMMLYPMLWLSWILQQLQVARIAGWIMPLLLFVTNSELRLTVTIFVRFCSKRAKAERLSWCDVQIYCQQQKNVADDDVGNLSSCVGCAYAVQWPIRFLCCISRQFSRGRSNAAFLSATTL